jgi:ketosteroid isomerase-like protein
VRSENVEVIHRVLEHWRREEQIPASLLDPGAEWVTPPEGVEPGTRSGASGFAAAERDFARSFRVRDLVVDRVEERGERVVTALTVAVEGRRSGAATEFRLSVLWTLRSGRLARFEWVNDGEAAAATLRTESA